MTTYSYGQLEALWINAGGPKIVAPIAAAIAIAESGGRSDAYNPSGASGVWQILGLPSGMPAGTNLFNATQNAKAAVLKYQQAGNSFTPWQTYTQGTYRQFLKGNVPPNTTGTGGSGGGGIQTTSITGDIISSIASALGLGADLKGFFIRGGLIILGGILLVAGLIMMGKGHDATNVNLTSSDSEEETTNSEVEEAEAA